MIRMLAMDRSRQIWGDQVKQVTPSVGGSPHKPGEVEWWIDLKNGRCHSIDCNGHAVCHQECADAEVQVAR